MSILIRGVKIGSIIFGVTLLLSMASIQLNIFSEIGGFILMIMILASSRIASTLGFQLVGGNPFRALPDTPLGWAGGVIGLTVIFAAVGLIISWLIWFIYYLKGKK